MQLRIDNVYELEENHIQEYALPVLTSFRVALCKYKLCRNKMKRNKQIKLINPLTSTRNYCIKANLKHLPFSSYFEIYYMVPYTNQYLVAPHYCTWTAEMLCLRS